MPSRSKYHAPSYCRLISRIIALAIAAFLIVPASDARESEHHPLHTLTSWRELHELTPDEAARDYPVHLRAVVTYAPPTDRHFWSQDKTTGGFAWMPAAKQSGLSLGQEVEMWGLSDPGRFGPCLRVTQIRVLRSGVIPKPVEVPLQRILSGAEDGRRFVLTGHLVSLRTLHRPSAVTRMYVVVEGTRFAVVLNGSPSQPAAALIDAEVRLAVTSSVTFNEKRQFTGVVLNLARPEDLIILTPGSIDIPVTPITELLRYGPGGGGVDNRRAKIEGTVTYEDPGKLIVIQNGEQAAFAQSAEREPNVIGKWVSVFGYPRARGYTPILIDARVASPRDGAKIRPVEITATDALSGIFDARLVRVRARLVDHRFSTEQQLLTLREGDTSFVAEFPAHSPDYVSGLEDRSDLALTGVLRVQTAAPTNTPQSFRLLLRSGADVEVIRRPSWLTRGRLAAIVLILFGIIVAVLVWVSVLRRQVLRQTRKLLEQRAREAQLERSHKVLVESATDLIFTLNRGGRFLSANPATERVTGLSLRELKRTNLRNLIPPAQHDAFERWLKHLQSNSYNSGEFEIQTQSGATRTVDLNAHVSESALEVQQIEFIARDVTERKRTQAALEQARHAAEAANEAKTRFLANMSHEIRTPLNAILGMADLLAETDLAPHQRTYVSTFQSSGRTLLHLLNGILDLARVEAGQLQLESIPFQLHEQVFDLVQMMKGRLKNKNVRLLCTIDKDVPVCVIGDANRLRQILTNLLGNAIKFTEEGEVSLRVSRDRGPARRSGAEEHARLTFAVKDTGIGIAGDKLERIFERFMQADNSTTRRFGGSGLGLSISRGLARSMAGDIEVRSEAGKGSEFILTLPFTVAKSTDVVTPSPALHRASGVLQRLRERPATVLLAEDNEANRMVVEAYFKNLPIKLDWAPNGVVAVEKERLNPYDLILMDVEMPELDGYEATRRICARRGAAGLPEIAILALTAHAFEEEKDASRQAGCTELLTKPIRRNVLLSAIDRHLPVAVSS